MRLIRSRRGGRWGGEIWGGALPLLRFLIWVYSEGLLGEGGSCQAQGIAGHRRLSGEGGRWAWGIVGWGGLAGTEGQDKESSEQREP